MAQQARPNVAGHSDDLRVQLTSFSTLASKMPLGSFSSRPIAYPRLVPVQSAATPHVGVGETERCDKQDDLHQSEDAQRVGADRERVEAADFDVEQDEQH